MAYTEIKNSEITITLAVEKVYPGLKQQLEEHLNNFPIKVIPVKKLSKAQNGLIHVLIKQFADELGWTMLDMKEYQKEQFAISRDLNKFSTAKCDMETANDFIAFLIEQALENDINLYILNKQDKRYRHILEIDKMTERYVIACLRKRVCCICGKEHNEYNTIELHHWNSVASIGGYENCDGLKTPFMSLCAKHHQEFHATGKETFKNKYYIEGVWLNVELVKELKKIYKNHFKAFKEDKE
ncbi:putative HNHc nuclease [Leptotrichia massiliensis]|uniref:putative HNHc nuclease n=1 Tax=Leptotrichia massiliensis TaxID=1852388 RepID=UPI0028CFF9CD|nr:putative HNHc nuclease [Leptotrichia massiliensis]